VCVKDSPTPDTTPDQVLKYLARYMTGGPISDRRLLRHEHGHVTVSARKGTKTEGSDETKDVRIPVVEFVRRWSLHILPKGYTKTRRFGGHSNHHRNRYIAACRELLPSGEPASETLPAVPVDAGLQEYRCPTCKALLIGTLLTSTSRTDRLGWRERSCPVLNVPTGTMMADTKMSETTHATFRSTPPNSPLFCPSSPVMLRGSDCFLPVHAGGKLCVSA
jgi:hypothetical protein